MPAQAGAGRTAMVQAWWKAQYRCGTGCGVCWPITHLLLGVLLHLVLGVKVRHSVGALQQAGEGGAAVSGVKIRQRSATFEAEPVQGCARVRPTNRTARAVQQRHTKACFCCSSRCGPPPHCSSHLQRLAGGRQCGASVLERAPHKVADPLPLCSVHQAYACRISLCFEGWVCVGWGVVGPGRGPQLSPPSWLRYGTTTAALH